MKTELDLPTLGLIAGTRGMLGAGIGLLLADRLSAEQRRAVGWTLLRGNDRGPEASGIPDFAHGISPLCRPTAPVFRHSGSPGGPARLWSYRVPCSGHEQLSRPSDRSVYRGAGFTGLAASLTRRWPPRMTGNAANT
ncbi:hypothetical protein AZKH_p0456 (plasmid) [Azoarcus sp. KH32C]|nr:hypothetical protein AZKH_p0456 [Azoarcus sp. KH32C]